MNTLHGQPKTHNHQITLEQITADMNALGTEAGRGKDTQVKALLRVTEGAYYGALDLNSNKHGHSTDDATKLAEAYYKAQTGAVVFDSKANSQSKLISCFRTMIRAGTWGKGGAGEPLATINNLMNERLKMRKDPTLVKQLDDAANTLLKYARAQLKRNTLIPQSELRDFCFRKQPEPRTAEDILEAARKQLQALYEGKAANGSAQDRSPHVKKAIDTLTDRLTEVAVEKGGGNVTTLEDTLVAA